eukprot:1950325-Rhodomonas_salina.2
MRGSELGHGGRAGAGVRGTLPRSRSPLPPPHPSQPSPSSSVRRERRWQGHASRGAEEEGRGRQGERREGERGRGSGCEMGGQRV